MQCPSCQAELPDNARFCGACGHQFQAPAAPVASSAAPASTKAPLSPAARAPNQALTKGNTMTARSIQEITSSPIQISIGEVAKEAFEMAKANLLPLIIGSIALGAASFFSMMIVIGMVALPAFMAGPVIVGAKMANGEEVSIGTWFGGFKKFVPLFILSLIVGVVVMAVYIAQMILIFLGTWTPILILGAVLLPVMQIAAYLVLDRDESPVESLKQAIEICKAHPIELFTFSAVANFINMLGLSVLGGLGGILTGPAAMLFTSIYIYRLLGMKGGISKID